MGTRYRFKDRYGATFQRNGSNETLFFSKGDEAELDDEVAEFINRDCPSILVRAKGTAKNAESVAEPVADSPTCETCGAEAGKPCVTAKGKPTKKSHKGRT